jgi:hypothetical protein
MVGPTERHCFRPDAFAKARAALRGKAAASLARIRRLIMRVSTNVAVVRVMAAAVFIGAAGLLVQSFAEGEQDEGPSAAGKISVAKAMAAAGEAAFPDFLVAPVRVRTVKVPAPEGGPSVPAGSDPRWARADLGKPATAAPPVAPALPEDSPRLASLDERKPDGGGISFFTGSTSGMMEIDIARHGDAREYVAIDDAVLDAARKDFAGDDAPGRTTRVTSDVRLRARGSNASEVIGVVPNGGAVGVVRCASWCEVTYQGKRGWVYSGFVSGYQRRRSAGRAAPAPQQEAAAAVAEAKPAATLGSRLFGNPAKPPETGIDD